MEVKEKVQELIEKIENAIDNGNYIKSEINQIAIIAVENEYNSLREMLFNLRSCHIIESEKVYLFRLQELIDLEKEIINQIKKL